MPTVDRSKCHFARSRAIFKTSNRSNQSNVLEWEVLSEFDTVSQNLSNLPLNHDLDFNLCMSSSNFTTSPSKSLGVQMLLLQINLVGHMWHASFVYEIVTHQNNSKHIMHSDTCGRTHWSELHFEMFWIEFWYTKVTPRHCLGLDLPWLKWKRQSPYALCRNGCVVSRPSGA